MVVEQSLRRHIVPEGAPASRHHLVVPHTIGIIQSYHDGIPSVLTHLRIPCMKGGAVDWGKDIEQAETIPEGGQRDHHESKESYD